MTHTTRLFDDNYDTRDMVYAATFYDPVAAHTYHDARILMLGVLTRLKGHYAQYLQAQQADALVAKINVDHARRSGMSLAAWLMHTNNV